MDIGLHGGGEVKVDDVGDILEVDSSGDAVLLVLGSVGVRCERSRVIVPSPGGVLPMNQTKRSRELCEFVQ